MEKYRRKVYVGDKTEESESLLNSNDEYLQLGNLHPKKREDLSPMTRSPKDQTIECDIQPKDTLHSLSLKYNIHLAELKRVNNILQESEFHALKRIKIPVKPASFLKDLIPGVHSEENRRKDGWYVDHKETQSNLSSSQVSTGFSSPCSETESSAEVFHESKDIKKVRRFLKEMDRDLERIKEKQATRPDGEEEGAEAVLEVGANREQVVYTNFNKDNEGLSNGSLVCWCFLLVLLVLALLAILMALMSVDHHTGIFQEEQNITSTKEGTVDGQ